MTLRSIAVISWAVMYLNKLSPHHSVSWNIILWKMRVKKETSLRRNFLIIVEVALWECFEFPERQKTARCHY